MVVTFSELGNQGRMGNAIFQAATTIALALRNGDDYRFPDSWEYKDCFNIPQDKFVKTPEFNSRYAEPFFHFAPIRYSNGVNLCGFFQSYLYFNDFEEQIKTLFKFKSDYDLQPNTTSIHVRRGDYVSLGNAYYPNLSETNYYERAMNITNTEYYYVFSDDIEWCRQKFHGDKFTFIKEPRPEIAMALMSSCENNIIANSSFSWWAAYLNKNNNKKVVAPINWFGPKLPHDTKDLIPNQWQRI